MGFREEIYLDIWRRVLERYGKNFRLWLRYRFVFGSGVFDVFYEWCIWEYKFLIGVYIGKFFFEENEWI